MELQLNEELYQLSFMTKYHRQLGCPRAERLHLPLGRRSAGLVNKRGTFLKTFLRNIKILHSLSKITKIDIG